MSPPGCLIVLYHRLRVPDTRLQIPDDARRVRVLCTYNVGFICQSQRQSIDETNHHRIHIRVAFATAPHPGISSAASLGCGPHAGRYTEGNTVGQVASDLARRRAHTPRLRVIFYWSDRHTSRHSSMLSSSRLRIFAFAARSQDELTCCNKGLCSMGRTDNATKCAAMAVARCGGAGWCS